MVGAPLIDSITPAAASLWSLSHPNLAAAPRWTETPGRSVRCVASPGSRPLRLRPAEVDKHDRDPSRPVRLVVQAVADCSLSFRAIRVEVDDVPALDVSESPEAHEAKSSASRSWSKWP